MHLSKHGIENIKRGLKRSWEPGGSHRTRQESREIDADTDRKRALHDRRGKTLISGMIPTELGAKPVSIRWSTSGRTDQLDVIVDGSIAVICRPSKVFDWVIPVTGNLGLAPKAEPICPHCLKAECDCSDSDASPDIGDK